MADKKYFYRLPFTNTGNADLFVTFVRLTNIKRTTVDWPRGIIAPGDTSEIIIHIDLTDFPGERYDNSVMVYSNCLAPDNLKIVQIGARVIQNEAQKRTIPPTNTE